MLGTSDPKWLFCMDRKGWAIPAATDVASLRDAWTAGARLVVVPRMLDGGNVREFLSEHGTTVLSTLDAELVRLR
jgi:hypothetical protein